MDQRRFETFRYAVIAAAAVAAALVGPPAWSWPVALPLLGLGTVALVFPLQLSLTHKVSIATTVFFAAAIVAPPAEAAAIAAGSELCSSVVAVVRRSRRTRTMPPPSVIAGTTLFNSAHAYLAVLVAALILELRAASPLVLVAAAVAMYVVNHTIVSMAVALKGGTNPARVFLDAQRLVVVQASAQYACGIVLAAAASWSLAALPLALVPAALVYVSLQRTVQLKQETIRAVERMADMVDRRDPYTYQHSRRVAEYAVELGRRLGFPREELALLRLAGAVHDLGKIAVPDSVLLKPGRLTEDEVRLMEAHPRTGYEILAEFREYAKVRELVLTHHERYAGGGYPSGLQGRSLPLIAQVIPVADTLDAMTSARPYRTPRSWAVALGELERGAGGQWNPEVVAAAVTIYGERARVIPQAAAQPA